MVCEALAGSADWRELPADERAIIFAAALFHDVAKPECTRTDADGRITSRAAHSRRGSIMARGILWRQAVPFAVRESITALVRYHQLPYFLIDRPDALCLRHEASQTTRCDHLALLAEADVHGRICPDQQRSARQYCPVPRILPRAELPYDAAPLRLGRTAGFFSFSNRNAIPTCRPTRTFVPTSFSCPACPVPARITTFAPMCPMYQ